MDYNAAIPGFARQRGSLVIDPSGLPSASDTWHLQPHVRPRLGGAEAGGLEEPMWQLSLRHSHDGMEEESGRYPERPGELDCVYYMRTGLCGYGMSCRFNHPPNRKMVVAAARNRGEYPERIGQPECQYYVKTGTCKFGATCKFHHPREKAGTAGRVALNVLGYPLRPNEKECAYYLRTGQCKYGATCKFNHPPPFVQLPGSPLYTPPVHSPSTPGPQTYPGGLPSWPVARGPFIQSPRWQGPSSYAPLILPQGMVPVPSWSTYPGQVGSISSPDGQQQAMGTGLFYRPSHQTHQTDPSGSGIQGSFSPYPPGSAGMRLPALQLPSSSAQRESMFPERPGQPECQFYMKTGDCKFGMTCRFHHPKDRKVPTPNCLLNPIGLPLRPGAPSCTFYSRYGICKFGPTCKFDHPMETSSYTLAASSPVDIPVVRHALGSSSAALTPSMSSEFTVERVAGRSKEYASTSEVHQQSSGGEDLEADVQRTTSSSIVDSTFS